MTPKRRSEDHREAWQNVALGFGILLCIATAVGLKLTSKDSTVVDVMAGVFMLLAVGLALPMRFKGFIGTVGEYIPRIGTPAARAVAAAEKSVDASQAAAIAVKEAVQPSKVDPEQPE